MKKKSILFLIIILILLPGFISAQVSFNPYPPYDIGEVLAGDDVEFTFYITYEGSSPVYYYIDFSEIYEYDQDWITSIWPTGFSFAYSGEPVAVTVQGQITSDLIFGINTFPIHIYEDAPFQVLIDTYDVRYDFQGTPGVEDHIEIISQNDSFFEGDLISFEGNFIDELPIGDEIDEWNLNIELASPDGYYSYANFTNSEGYWHFFAPILPQNISFYRNGQGQIQGVLKITGTDTDGYTHIATQVVGINKEPFTPIIYAFPENNNVRVMINNSGGTENILYYDTDSGEPYIGTGLTQGDSPINIGNSTEFLLDGFQSCTKYYFSVKVSNQFGTSNFSNECSFKIFSANNGLPIRYHLNECIISNSIEFEENHYFSGNLIIEEGAELEINGGILYFEENSKIIIEPGGKLILNGATCTAPCGQTWQGIEVWGDSDEHQFTIDDVCSQGKLVLQNGASIENAWNAVSLWKPDNWNMTGGIVVATNSTFKNNKRSIEFISYHNYQPISGERMQNLSYFTNCKFTVDEDYVIPSEFETHISMFDVEGINIKGCEFSNYIAASQNTGYGIYTLDAGYQIGSYCSASISPCPPEYTTPTTFSNLYSGVCAGNSGSINTVYVNGAEFHNNSYGVQLNAVDNATVIFNKFYVGPNVKNASICSLTYGIGIDINNSNGYAIEENKFYSAEGINGEVIGLRVNYNPDPYNHIPDVDYNEIYLNEFYSLRIANTAEGQNLNLDEPSLGLNYLCNKNSNNGFDFYFTGKGVRYHQGDNEKPAGNTFSLNGNNPYSDINNQAVWDILYHYDRNEYYEIPQYYNEKVYPIANSNYNNCDSHFGVGDQRQATGMGLTAIQLQYFEQEFYDNRSDYNGTKALYESLIDGGSTPAAITDIETAWPDEMWDVRAELLAMSPHLSADVLKKTADRTDLFPDAVIYEIFAANPDALRDRSLIEYLQTKEEPLPQYMVDALISGCGTVTYKTILQSQLAEYSEKMISSANIIIRNMLNDSLVNNDSIQSWLVRIHTMAHDYQLIDNYLQSGNTVAAISFLNNLPVEYLFEDADTTEYHFYKTLKQLQASVMDNDRNSFQLAAGEKNEIETVADNSISRAGTQARNIMAFVFGNEYADCPKIPDSVTYKQSKASIYNFAENMLSVEALPNPAKSWTAFNYSYPEIYQNGMIQIRDTKGQVIQVIKLDKPEGQFIWDTRRVPPGIYLFTLQTDGYTKTGKLIVTK